MEESRGRTYDDVLNDLNDTLSEMEDIGEHIIDVVIDARADEGLPPFTPDELREAEAECDRNAEEFQRLEARLDELRLEFFGLTGNWPYYQDGVIPRYYAANPRRAFWL